MGMGQVLDGLVDCEMAMCDLYKAMAPRFPERKAVLDRLAEEENRHAVTMRHARDVFAKAGIIKGDDIRATTEQIASLYRRIRTLMVTVESGAGRWPEFVGELAELERGTGELDVYRIIRAHRDHPAVSFFADILEEEEGHEALLREWLEEMPA